MEAASLPESEGSVMSVEEIVLEYLREHPDAKFVNREVFYPAYFQRQIRQLLNYEVLYPPLLMHQDLVKTEEDMKRFTSSFNQPHDQHIALIELLERGGEYGFMLLYIYICETITTPGHSEAARILTEAGIISRSYTNLTTSG